MTLYREVDVEGMVSRFLREQPEVTAAVDQRVYTDLPHDRTYPLVLIQRSGGNAVSGWGLSSVDITVAVYGGTHKQAQDLTSLILALLASLSGPQPEGSVSGVTATNCEFAPDADSPDSQGHARPRYVSTATVYAHP